MVLLISNDEPFLKRIEAIISEAQINVETCRSLSEALVAVGARKVRMIVLDEHLPDCDVWGCCEELRRRTAVPILITGSEAASPAIIRAIQSGGDFYLKRPLHNAEFMARLKALLRRQLISSGNGLVNIA